MLAEHHLIYKQEKITSMEMTLPISEYKRHFQNIKIVAGERGIVFGESLCAAQSLTRTSVPS